MTNLKEGTTAQILRLYRKRWAIEQKYHTLKNKLKFESVTGKASIYVEQDFWAQTLVFNMVQDLITAAECRAKKKAKKKRLKYEMRINENIAIGLFKEQFIRLMIEEDDSRKDEMFRRLTADMERNIVPVRKLRSSPRKWKYFNKYKCNLKPSF
jgi:transposase